jgi:hypothetical protein
MYFCEKAAGKQQINKKMKLIVALNGKRFGLRSFLSLKQKLRLKHIFKSRQFINNKTGILIKNVKVGILNYKYLNPINRTSKKYLFPLFSSKEYFNKGII